MIYPQIEINSLENLVVIDSKLRVLHDGKWYLRKMNLSYYHEFEDNYLENLIQRFNKEVYHVIINGEVDLSLTDKYRRNVFELDPDQTPEKERLTNILNNKP